MSLAYPSDDEIRAAGMIVLRDDARPQWELVLFESPQCKTPRVEMFIDSFSSGVIQAWQERIQRLRHS